MLKEFFHCLFVIIIYTTASIVYPTGAWYFMIMAVCYISQTYLRHQVAELQKEVKLLKNPVIKEDRPAIPKKDVFAAANEKKQLKANKQMAAYLEAQHITK